MKKIVLAGGGTAGHIMPHIAVLPALRQAFGEIHYIGTGGMEKALMSAIPDVIFHEIRAPKLKRGFSPDNLLVPFRLLGGICAAKKILKSVAPDVIFSKGGYAALPVALAAGKIPVILHESDCSMGLANKLSAGRAAKILSSFPIKHAIHTGAPIRPSLYLGSKERGLRAAGLSGRKPVLLAVGGSLGARTLNAALRAALPALTPEFDVVHICGKGNVSPSLTDCAQLEFVRDPADIYAAADLVLSRAGSNAIFEFAALGKPALLVPLPRAASRGDQEDNAESFRKNGWARVCPQSALTAERLAAELKDLYVNRKALLSALSAASFDGTQKIIKEILSL